MKTEFCKSVVNHMPINLYLRKLTLMPIFAVILFVLSFSMAQAAPLFSSIAVDARTGQILSGQDIDGLRHPASLAKVMTLYVLFEDLRADRIDLNSKLLVSRRASLMAPSKLGLKPGNTISVENAIKALVTKSANDVAATVGENLGGSEADFAKRMTRTARVLGMSRTTFKSASGLPNKDEWTTARDMATLGLRIQRDFPEYYHYFSTLSFTYKGQTFRTHNRLLGKYDGVDGIKTGYIAAAGFNLTTSVKRGDKRIVGVVLGANSTVSRNQYMVDMLDRTLPACRAGSTLASIVGNGKDLPPTLMLADESPAAISTSAVKSSPINSSPIKTAVAKTAVTKTQVSSKKTSRQVQIVRTSSKKTVLASTK